MFIFIGLAQIPLEILNLTEIYHFLNLHIQHMFSLFKLYNQHFHEIACLLFDDSNIFGSFSRENERITAPWPFQK